MLLDALAAVGGQLAAVRIVTQEQDATFADLVFSNGAEVDARASDAIVLALLAQVPLLASTQLLADLARAELMEKAGVTR